MAMLFDSIIARLRAADRNTRLETLLDYSRKLRDLPPSLQAASDRASHRVNECQTPVFLWALLHDGKVALHADAPREAPTVRGFLALLQSRLDGATAAEVAAIPNDLLDQLGIAELLGMTRTHGLTAVLLRVKALVAEVDPQA
ncbi:MAG TPA: SufE family protein [Gemmatimonadales bacterium]|jgi:cysteine desulfuration protein SufE